MPREGIVCHACDEMADMQVQMPAQVLILMCQCRAKAFPSGHYTPGELPSNSDLPDGWEKQELLA